MQGDFITELWKATFKFRNYKTADDWLALRKPFGDVLVCVFVSIETAIHETNQTFRLFLYLKHVLFFFRKKKLKKLITMCP